MICHFLFFNLLEEWLYSYVFFIIKIISLQNTNIMSTNISRRKWLQSAGLATTGLAIAPGMTAFAAKPLEGKTYYQGTRTWEVNLFMPAESDKLQARLLANENPYGPSDKTKLAIIESVSSGNRYGHEVADYFMEMLAEKENVKKDSIMLSPGSTDILEKMAIYYFSKGGNIVSADPAYMSLIRTSMAFGAEWRNVPLTKSWGHDLAGMEKAIDKDTKLIYICNPNNPTGSLTDTKALRDFCSRVSEKVPVFVDEAYLEFLDEPEKHSMADLVAKGKNVIIARTFSKIHSMAGLRMGYCVALPETLDNVRGMVRTTMGLNVTALKGAIASMQDTEFQANSRKWTKETREFTMASLKKLGYEPIPSHTSFMLFPLQADMEGKSYLEKMQQYGVGVRVFNVFDADWCRVSMGTMEEMKLFVNTFEKVVG